VKKSQVRLAGNRAQEQFVTNVIKQTIMAAEFPVPATVKPENSISKLKLLRH
jgi:hypothetical protein